jgi:hypothetical protein
MQKIPGLSRYVLISVACCASTLFASQFPSFGANSPTESWTVGRGEANGKPIFVRINMALKPSDPKFPFRAVYAMSFLHPTQDGRPERAETAKANEIEDQLNALIAQKGSGKFVAVQTHDGIRKFLFYVDDEKSAHDAESALKVPKEYKIDLNVTKDPAWVVYGKIRSEHERVRTTK